MTEQELNEIEGVFRTYLTFRACGYSPDFNVIVQTADNVMEKAQDLLAEVRRLTKEHHNPLRYDDSGLAD